MSTRSASLWLGSDFLPLTDIRRPTSVILSEPLQNVQTALVPSAGSSVFVMDGRQLVPTNTEVGDLNILVDHALPYFRKGALGLMTVAKPN